MINILKEHLEREEYDRIIIKLEQLLKESEEAEKLRNVLPTKDFLNLVKGSNWREWWTIARVARIVGDTELVDKACSIILSENPGFTYAREFPKHARGYYAQIGQDKIIEQFFQKYPPTNKIFVDVGAFDGVNYSNVRRLYETYGWTGLCIEPVEKNYKLLVKSYKGSSVRCLKVGISNWDGEADINVVTWPGLPGWGSEVSTFSKEEMARWEQYKPVWNLEHIILKKLTTVLNEEKIEAFDLLSVDTEGHDLEVLQGLDFSRFKPSLIVVEYGQRRQEIISFLESKGYRIFSDNGQDIFAECVSQCHIDVIPSMDVGKESLEPSIKLSDQTLQPLCQNASIEIRGVSDSIPMYFSTVSDEKHYPMLLNLIGCLHRLHFDDIAEISVFNLGLTQQQKQELLQIEKVALCEIEKTNPYIFDLIETGPNRVVRGLFSWKPVVIKQSLDKYPYVLYMDAGTTILKSLTGLFKHIIQNGYFLTDCGKSIRWQATKTVIDRLKVEPELLADDVLGVTAGFIGVSRSFYDNFIKPVYELCFDINNFIDDGSCPEGYGCARHDQTLFSIQARRLGLKVYNHDREPCEAFFEYDGLKEPVYITHFVERVNEKTTIFHSIRYLDPHLFQVNLSSIRRKQPDNILTGKSIQASSIRSNALKEHKALIGAWGFGYNILRKEKEKKNLEHYIPISFLVGVYNEEHRIRYVLEHAIRWADEVIVVNKSSTDRTKEICLEYGEKVKVIDIPFSPRGHEDVIAISKLPSYDWIFIGPASEIPTRKLIKRCREILNETNGELDLVYVPRKYYSFGIHDKRSPWSISYFPFLINRKKAIITNVIHHNFRPSNPNNTRIIEFSDECCVYHLTHVSAKAYMRDMTDYFEAEAASCTDPKAKIKECFAYIARFQQQLLEGGDELLGHYLAWPIYWLGTALFVWEKK